MDTLEAREVVKAANYLKRLSKGIFVIDIMAGGYEIVEAYREGKDWFKEAVNVGIDIGFGTAIPWVIEGALGFLSLTPVGWIAIITVGSIEAGSAIYMAYLTEKSANPYI